MNREVTTKTRLLDGRQPESLAVAAGLLQAGELVVFPTDTVYGVGCLPFDEHAIRNLYDVKQRPVDKGIPILLADATDLPLVCRELPESAQALIERYWPGPLTLIVPRQPELPEMISRRYHCSSYSRQRYSRNPDPCGGGAVAASSANRSGQPPAVSGDGALRSLGEMVAAVVDGGPTPDDQPSTIIDCTGPVPRILRRGPLSASDLNTFGNMEDLA
ncbi:MAG: L-threonylcarbamoyladenylate synthase [Chloroflexota bacterium]